MEGLYTQRVHILPIYVPKTIPGMVFGTRVPKWAVYGPFGIRMAQDYIPGIGGLCKDFAW